MTSQALIAQANALIDRLTAKFVTTPYDAPASWRLRRVALKACRRSIRRQGLERLYPLLVGE